jgi:hypothetical protein
VTCRFDVGRNQQAHASIYAAVYPARIFSSDRLRENLSGSGWRLIEEFDTLEGPMKTSAGVPFTWTGMLWARDAARSGSEELHADE